MNTTSVLPETSVPCSTDIWICPRSSSCQAAINNANFV